MRMAAPQFGHSSGSTSENKLNSTVRRKGT
jgi:hypothetical protein